MDQTDPWQVVHRQVFTPYDCFILISVAVVVLSHTGCFWVTVVWYLLTHLIFSFVEDIQDYFSMCL